MYDTTKPYKNKILKLISNTRHTPYVSIRGGIYSTINRKINYPEIDHTDGIGTKGIYHWQKRTFKNAVLDTLAMNLNDLAMARAIPYKLQNHIIIPKDDHRAILEIISQLSKECVKRKIAITGGETSIHNNSEGMDISMTVSGFIPKQKNNLFRKGDVLFGIRSTGLHSNGFTKVREIFGSNYRPEFIVPTKIYTDQILKLDKAVKINGMMHITGGAFTKLKQILPKNCDVIIKRNHHLKPHNIFRELNERGIGDKDMYKTFNCGVGFIFSANSRNSKKIRISHNLRVIGQVISGTGKMSIESMFSNKIIEF